MIVAPGVQIVDCASLPSRAATFGSIAYGLGGLFLSTVNLLPIMFCAAWLPLTCLFARRFLLRPNARDFALASLALGMQCLVAEPTTILQTGILLGMYALYRGWHSAARFASALRNAVWGFPRAFHQTADSSRPIRSAQTVWRQPRLTSTSSCSGFHPSDRTAAKYGRYS